MKLALTLLALAAVTEIAPAQDAESYRLGDVPGTVAAFRAGRDRAPTNDAMRRGLADARAAVAYPVGLAPAPLDGFRQTVSALDLLCLSAAAGLAVFAGGVHLNLGIARRGYALAVAGLVGWGGVALLAVAVEVERRADDAKPALVVAEQVTLRAGNGPNFPPRLAGPLPPGVECVLLHRRGGWVQVALYDGTPGGLVGWLPEGSVIVATAGTRISP